MAKEIVIQGDCLDVLKTFEDNSVDAVVTDPPYGLSKEPDINEVLTKWLAGEPYDHGHGGFMGKSWDSFVPHPDIWREVFRVLKPGGHALVFAGTRTQDLMTISLRLAGFEVRDVIEWLYFSGLPKSYDVSKAFDKRAGAEREVIREYVAPDGNSRTNGTHFSAGEIGGKRPKKDYLTAPATDLAKQWNGWGTALKPAHEPIIVVRKPLIDTDTGRKLTVADCVEKYGTGAINIDACRINSAPRTTHKDRNKRTTNAAEGNLSGGKDIATFNLSVKKGEWAPVEKRFPANCITLDDDAFYSKYFNISPPELSKKASKKDRNSDWRGEEIALEPKDSGVLVASTRGQLKDLRISNPEYERKVPKNANTHPTVKPTDLMAWLIRLVTPPNGVVLDPFAGSGSTLVAAKREGFGFIGIEREPEYVEIIEARTHVKAIKGEGEATK